MGWFCYQIFSNNLWPCLSETLRFAALTKVSEDPDEKWRNIQLRNTQQLEINAACLVDEREARTRAETVIEDVVVLLQY